MKLRTAICAAALAVLPTAPALAQGSASQVTYGTITVMDPVELTHTSESEVQVATRPSSGAAVVQIEGSTYKLTGLDGDSFNVSTPTSLTLTRRGGDEQIVIDLAPNQTSGVLKGKRTGSTSIQVDGAAPVTSETAAGLYTGQYDVTVDYP